MAAVEDKRFADGTGVKILFAISCVIIGSVLLCIGGIAVVFGFLWYVSYNGVVRQDAPVYAATDEQSLLSLENAETKGEDLPALAAASNHHIVLIAPKTPVRRQKESFYDQGKLSPNSSSPSSRPILRVKVLDGPEKGRTMWIAERDVGFHALAL